MRNYFLNLFSTKNDLEKRINLIPKEKLMSAFESKSYNDI